MSGPIALVRHCPAQVAPGLCYGRLDLPTTPLGPAVLAPLRAALAGLEAAPLWSSPARRCRDLAEALAEGRSIRLEARLLELDFGAWEGQPWDAVPRDALDRWAADPWGFAPPGGESGAALVARLRAFQAELRGPAVVVAHGGSLKVLAALLEGRPVDLLAPAQPLGSVRRVAGAPGASEEE